MKAAIIQSNYIPWRGYFDIIDDVDKFIIHDDLQYTKQDWRNRNYIKAQNGKIWLTVPVHYDQVDQKIEETRIAQTTKWWKKHLALIENNYRKTKFFHNFFPELEALIHADYTSLSALNITLINWANDKLNIETPIILSSEIKVAGSKTEKVLNLLKAVGADFYLSGPSAQNYLQLDLFRDAGISLAYKTYDYDPYPQLWGEFEGTISVIDLLFNTGPEARAYLKSRSAYQIIPTTLSEP